VFWGGYQVEERHSHLYWIHAYGLGALGRVGLDATVDEDAGLDFRFVNSSPDYVLIQTSTDDRTVAISLYGTKPRWTVKVDGPTITNVKSARHEVVHYPEPSLPWGERVHTESAADGFDVTLVRTVTDAGAEPRVLRLRTQYEPAQNLVVVGVRGAPAGTAERIRAANPRVTPSDTSTSVASAPAASAATAVPVSPVVTPAAAAPTVGVADPTRGPIATPVPTVTTRQAPAASSSSAGGSSVQSRPTAASASSTQPSAPVAPTANIPRFSGGAGSAPSTQSSGGAASSAGPAAP
jgi:hypothetical protein